MSEAGSQDSWLPGPGDPRTGTDPHPWHYKARETILKWCLPASMSFGRTTSKTACQQCLCPYRASQLPPASMEGSQRSANGSDVGSFQSTGSALGFVACEILLLSSKGGVSISYSPPALLYTNHTGLQSLRF